MRWFGVAAKLGLAITACVTIAGGVVAQQAYPTRPVKFILPFNPASATDITARLFADRLSQRWGKPVVVENRPGGDGIVSLQAFKSADDDHTLWFGPAGHFHRAAVRPRQPAARHPARSGTGRQRVGRCARGLGAGVVEHQFDRPTHRARESAAGQAQRRGVSGHFRLPAVRLDQETRSGYRQSALSRHHAGAERSRAGAYSGALEVVCGGAAVDAGRQDQGARGDEPAACADRAAEIPTATEVGYPDLTFESIGGIFGPRGISDSARAAIADGFVLYPPIQLSPSALAISGRSSI